MNHTRIYAIELTFETHPKGSFDLAFRLGDKPF